VFSFTQPLATGRTLAAARAIGDDVRIDYVRRREERG
jgi:hypothetical protein